MQILLVTGPGGAGASTVAAATAVQLAAAGSRCVLLTTRATPVAGLDGAVRVESVAPLPILEQVWARHLEALSAALPVAVPPASSVVPVPAAAEFALLAALAGHAAAGRTDVVVLDAGPTATALGLVALPGALRWWLTQAAPPRLRVLATLRSAVAPGRPGGAAAALGGAAALEELIGQVPLADPARTAVHLVLRPEPAAVGELRTTATALAVLGQRVASVTVDRVLPALPGEWGARRAQVQQTALDELSATAGPLREVAETAVPPADVPALLALDAAVPGADPAPVPQPTPHRDGAGWLLALPLPFARRGAVELTRWADDLVVSAAGQRRSVPLDPLLRRCTVSGGTLAAPGTAGATLEVRFTPDRAQWPTGLLEAEEIRA
ncbi:arsenite-transporting ATPase [Modestobacter sp. DSM 44400]|uniref:ArsA family ATPase n=1 Tax=Modestobacter sp. DSM 44400 TaxID=1550230 RepID=UPI00089AE245|nr:ArsA-related P-loop ATPase [Modestobacter sp. DSM 44400]SDY77181.1 arsenite-transporting ATPase [Modestobacter sp. DSM 44400]